jgi:hypothetical protein
MVAAVGEVDATAADLDEEEDVEPGQLVGVLTDEGLPET